MGGFVPFRSFSPTKALHSPVFWGDFSPPYEMKNNALPKGSLDGCAESEKLVEPVSCLFADCADGAELPPPPLLPSQQVLN